MSREPSLTPTPSAPESPCVGCPSRVGCKVPCDTLAALLPRAESRAYAETSSVALMEGRGRFAANPVAHEEPLWFGSMVAAAYGPSSAPRSKRSRGNNGARSMRNSAVSQRIGSPRVSGAPESTPAACSVRPSPRFAASLALCRLRTLSRTCSALQSRPMKRSSPCLTVQTIRSAMSHIHSSHAMSTVIHHGPPTEAAAPVLRGLRALRLPPGVLVTHGTARRTPPEVC